MASSNQEKKFVNTMMYMMVAPTIVAPGYEDMITKDLKSKAQLYRMTAQQNVEQERCSDFDAMLYLMTISYLQPLTHSWKKIYQHLFLKYYDINQIDTDPEKQNWIRRDAELGEEELHSLHKLQRWIFKRQMEHIR